MLELRPTCEHCDNFLGKDRASTRVRHRPVDPLAHATFAAAIKDVPPESR